METTKNRMLLSEKEVEALKQTSYINLLSEIVLCRENVFSPMYYVYFKNEPDLTTVGMMCIRIGQIMEKEFFESMLKIR